MIVSSNAYDNPKKRGVRDKISDVINKHFGESSNISMCELLGEGVGLERYLRTIKGILNITVVERNFENYRKFISSSKLTSLRNKYSANTISAIRINIDKLFKKKRSFDVVNLDFCGIFKKQVVSSTTSNVIPVESMFRCKSLHDNGLVFLTYKIGGWLPMGWDHEDILVSPDDICDEIKQIASKHNYALTEVHRVTYKSHEGGRGTASDMLSLGFSARYK
jgi:hypothetical protein